MIQSSSYLASTIGEVFLYEAAPEVQNIIAKEFVPPKGEQETKYDCLKD